MKFPQFNLFTLEKSDWNYEVFFSHVHIVIEMRYYNL